MMNYSCATLLARPPALDRSASSLIGIMIEDSPG